ncbi:MAG TPA: hypothetical protein VGP72_06210 [Planctomycetota bacterium]|jgi:hypothetical protein
MQFRRFILFLFLSAAPAFCAAEGLRELTGDAQLAQALQRKVSFELADTACEEALSFLTSLSKLNVIIDPRCDLAKKKVSLNIQNLAFHEALTQVLEPAGLEYQAGDEALYVAPRNAPKRPRLQPLAATPGWQGSCKHVMQRRISIELDRTPVAEALAFFQSFGRTFAILVDPALEEANPPVLVNLQASDISLEHALLWMLRLNDLNYEARDEAIFVYRNGAHRPDIQPLTPSQAQALTDAVARLGAADFQSRQRASQQIEALGLAAVAILRQEASKTADVEVRTRIDTLVAKLSCPSIFDEPPDVTHALADINFGGKVRLDLSQRSLEDVLQELNIEDCVSYGSSWKSSASRRISICVTEVERANALRWAVRLAGGKLAVSGGKLVIIPGPLAK